MTEFKLSTEERTAIVKDAAKEAADMVKTEFFAEIGRAMVKRFLIIVGACVVAFALGKGWISLPKGD